MSLQFAVFGTPIAHSLSPRIHAAFAKQTGIDLDYVAIEAGPVEFTTLLEQFAARGGAGANITLPLKRRAFELANSHAARAARMGVANTLVRRDDGVVQRCNDWAEVPAETDLVVRNELIEKALVLANDDVAYLPLHNQVIPWAMRKNVEVIHRADNRLDWRLIQVK